nr:uncharacterized protein LOC127332388 isoform X2 [Lolium perenne]
MDLEVCRFSVGLLELCFGSACWRFIGVQPKLQSCVGREQVLARLHEMGGGVEDDRRARRRRTQLTSFSPYRVWMSRRFTESDNNHHWPLWTPSLPQAMESSKVGQELQINNHSIWFSSSLNSGYSCCIAVTFLGSSTSVVNCDGFPLLHLSLLQEIQYPF